MEFEYTTQRIPPTQRQRDFEILFEQMTVDGVTPTFRSVGKAMGITTRAARSLAVGLISRGRARMIYGRPHSFELIKERERA